MLRVLAATLAIAGVFTHAGAQDIENIKVTPELIEKAKAEGEVNVLYGNALTAMQKFVAAFQGKYPDIKVNIERKSGAPGAEQIMTESKSGVHRFDVMEATDFASMKDLAESGIFKAAAPPNVGEFSDDSKLMVPYFYSPAVLRSVVAYNPDIVTPEDAAKLRSWKGILDPVFKDSIIMGPPIYGGSSVPLLYIMNTPDLGEKFLKDLKQQNPTIFPIFAQAREALVAGQYKVFFGQVWDAIAFSEYGSGSPLRFVYPNPTPEWVGDGWGIVKDAPHPNAARLFYAFILSADGLKAWQSEEISNVSTLKGTSDNRPLEKKLRGEDWYQDPKEFWHPSVKDWINNMEKYRQVWNSIFDKR